MTGRCRDSHIPKVVMPELAPGASTSWFPVKKTWMAWTGPAMTMQQSRKYWGPSPARRQPLQAAQHEGWPPFRVDSVFQPQVRDPPQQGRNRDLGLDPRQLGAE